MTPTDGLTLQLPEQSPQSSVYISSVKKEACKHQRGVEDLFAPYGVFQLKT